MTKITIVTTMRNEAPYILEWIAHHRAAGVSGFLVYTNDCGDGTDAVLDILDEAKIVMHVRQGEINKSPQWTALKAAWTHPLVEASDWLACIDCDEFIRLPVGVENLQDMIDTRECDAFLMRWRLFGSSGQATLAEGLTTQRFVQAAPAVMIYPALGNYFKTLFRRAGPFRQFGVHRPRQKKAERQGLPVWSDGSERSLPQSLVENDARILHLGPPHTSDSLQLNHYSLRSAAEFILKRDRGLPNHRNKNLDLNYWVERNFNQVEDKSIQNMEARTRRELKVLRGLDGVEKILCDARAWCDERFEALLTNPDTLALYGRLLLSQTSVAPNAKQSHDLIQRYGEVHGD